MRHQRKQNPVLYDMVPGETLKAKSDWMQDTLGLQSRRAQAYLYREAPIPAKYAVMLEEATGVSRCYWVWPDDFNVRGERI